MQCNHPAAPLKPTELAPLQLIPKAVLSSSSLAPHDLHSLLLHKIENQTPQLIPQLSIICFVWGTHLALLDFSLGLQSAQTLRAFEVIEFYLVDLRVLRKRGCGVGSGSIWFGVSGLDSWIRGL